MQGVLATKTPCKSYCNSILRRNKMELEKEVIDSNIKFEGRNSEKKEEFVDIEVEINCSRYFFSRIV